MLAEFKEWRDSQEERARKKKIQNKEAVVIAYTQVKEIVANVWEWAEIPFEEKSWNREGAVHEFEKKKSELFLDSGVLPVHIENLQYSLGLKPDYEKGDQERFSLESSTGKESVKLVVGETRARLSVRLGTVDDQSPFSIGGVLKQDVSTERRVRKILSTINYWRHKQEEFRDSHIGKYRSQ